MCLLLTSTTNTNTNNNNNNNNNSNINSSNINNSNSSINDNTNKNKKMEETSVMNSAVKPIVGEQGKATKRRRLNAVLDKLTSNLQPDLPDPPLDQHPQHQHLQRHQIEFELEVQTKIKSESSESDESDGEKLKALSPTSSPSLSSPLLPSSTLSSPLLPTSSPSKSFSPLRLKNEDKLKSPSKMTFSFSPVRPPNDPNDPVRPPNDPNDPLQPLSDPEDPGVDPLEAESSPLAENYENYIKSQILSKMYLQQYRANNINPTGTLQVQGARAQANPLDLSTRPEPVFSQPETVFNQTKYQVSALLMQAHSSENGKLVIAGSESPENGGKGRHECTVCGQTFSVQDRLSKHMASRHKSRGGESSKAYYCDVCKRSFARSDMLTRHMRLHTGHKPYTCRVCGQVFSRSDHLSTHQRTHTGEKPYRCTACPYSACRRDMITRHMRTHSRPEPGGETPVLDLLPPNGLSKLDSQTGRSQLDPQNHGLPKLEPQSYHGLPKLEPQSHHGLSQQDPHGLSVLEHQQQLLQSIAPPARSKMDSS